MLSKVNDGLACCVPEGRYTKALLRQADSSLISCEEIMATYELLGVGNALVDVLCNVDDSFLHEHGLVKGSMQLVDESEANNLVSTMSTSHRASGGSCANSMAGFASLGGRGAFIGKLKNDSAGKAFQADMKMLGCSFAAVPSEQGLPTGMCLVFVTPDAQRTMCTHLGTAALLAPDDLNETVISGSKIIYMEGYLFDQPVAQEAMVRAAGVANRAGGKVALTLSDSFCVERHRDAFVELIESNTDILFANEDEFKSLYQVENLEQAVQLSRGKCDVICVTRGERGAVIISDSETIEVKSEAVERLIDTTGAGDQFAAGFLFGLCKDKDLTASARIGAIAAAEVIGHYGARPEKDLAELVAGRLG